MGFTQKQAVGILYVISAILGLSAVILTTSGALKAMIFLLAMCAAGVVAGKIFLSNNDEGKKRPSATASSASSPTGTEPAAPDQKEEEHE